MGTKKNSSPLHAVHVGAILGLANAVFSAFMFLVALLTIQIVPVWVNLIIAYPLLLIIFWVWFTQEIRMKHKRISGHDGLLVAKLGILPFVILFSVAAVLFATQFPEGSIELISVGYYGMLTGIGNIFLGLTLVTVGLHGFHFHVTNER